MSDPLIDLRAALASEDLNAISTAARAVIDAAPALGGGWGEVTQAALTAGDDLTALRAAQLLTDSAPGHVESWLWLASVYSALGQPGQAVQALDARRTQFAASGALHRRMGRALLEMRQTARAEACFRAALKIDVYDALAWEGLAHCKTFARGDEDLAVMEEVRIGWPDDAPSEKRGVLSYAIARAYDDLDEFETVGRRVAEGAAFYREAAPFDIDGHMAGVDHILRLYDSRFTGANDEAGVADARAVMIFAPPRSGAAWLGEVLGCCDGAFSLPRSNAIFWAASSLLGYSTPEDLLQAVEAGGENALTEVGRLYLDRLIERAGRKASRIIDPSALLEIAGGAAGLCLPAARFVRITRDPRDAAWSIYAHRFAKGRHWGYHPDDIAKVLSAHNRLCDRWAALYPERFLTVAYEDLAADPKAVAGEIARFARLDDETAGAEAWLRSDEISKDPPGVHERAGSRFEAVEAALQRAGLV